MTRQPSSPQFPAFFVSADWSKDTRKRSVHVADLSNRRICREERDDWNLTRLLELSKGLANRAPVLLGVDAALGVPPGYWAEVQALDWGSAGAPANFVDWLSRLDPDSDFFEAVRESVEWEVGRPFFHVPGRTGGLSGFTSLFGDRLRRRIDKLTGAKPLFAVSGIPGTVGSGTRELWKELIPLLAEERCFAVWPFEAELSELLARNKIVLAETYPGLAYAAALADHLPTSPLRVAKTRSDSRRQACNDLEAMRWVQEFSVELGDLDPARADEDAFDSHFTAAAVLRCALEDRGSCDREWIDSQAGGAMLLAGPVDPSSSAQTLRARQDSALRRSVPQPLVLAGHAEYPCPIRGCTHVFRDSRGGWDAHVASHRRHPDWYPSVFDGDERKRRFRDDFRSWFRT